MIPELYEHQADLRDRVRASLMKHRATIACMPPGGGKTRIAKHILGAAAERPEIEGRSGNLLFTVHRRGLVFNAANSFAEDPRLEHAVLMSGVETSPGQKVQVASIDTLLSWYAEDGQYTSDYTFDVIVFDECHSHHSKLMTYLAAHNTKRKELGLVEPFVIGLTATPQAKGLADLYGEIVLGPTTKWLTDNGFLKPFRYFQAKQGQLGRLIRKGDEFTSDSVSAAMEGLGGDLVRDWLKYGAGRSTVGFFPRREHAKEAMELLSAAGVKAAYVDGDTPDDERNQMFRDLDELRLDYICNVGVIERGTDIPSIGCVQICTAVGSIVRWLQMVGRGSRKHPEVTECVVLDHGGNVARHGMFDDPVTWTLDWSSRPSKEHQARPTVSCPKCNRIYRGGKCSCGYEPTPKEYKAQGLEFDGSELVEISKKPRQKKQQTSEQIFVQSLYRAGRSGMTVRQAVGIAYSEARKQGVDFQVPKTFKVAGMQYQTIPRNHADSSRRVKAMYPFTVGEYGADANSYQLGEAS